MKAQAEKMTVQKMKRALLVIPPSFTKHSTNRCAGQHRQRMLRQQQDLRKHVGGHCAGGLVRRHFAAAGVAAPILQGNSVHAAASTCAPHYSMMGHDQRFYASDLSSALVHTNSSCPTLVHTTSSSPALDTDSSSPADKSASSSSSSPLENNRKPAGARIGNIGQAKNTGGKTAGFYTSKHRPKSNSSRPTDTTAFATCQKNSSESSLHDGSSNSSIRSGKSSIRSSEAPTFGSADVGGSAGSSVTFSATSSTRRGLRFVPPPYPVDPKSSNATQQQQEVPKNGADSSSKPGSPGTRRGGSTPSSNVVVEGVRRPADGYTVVDVVDAVGGSASTSKDAVATFDTHWDEIVNAQTLENLVSRGVLLEGIVRIPAFHTETCFIEVQVPGASRERYVYVV